MTEEPHCSNAQGSGWPSLPQRFTLDGSAQLEARLQELCERVRSEALDVVPPDKWEGLVLGGGYGRGHGGVLRTAAGDFPYNDLEFYVFLKGSSILNNARYRKRFEDLGHSLSPQAGLHVEFKIDSLEKLRRGAVSLFSYDLVSAHRVLLGGPTLFARCEHHLESTAIMSNEATRLLLNRCSGLLLAKELFLKYSLTPDDCDFIGRNLAKAKLALGDALLILEGQYHWDCRERGRRLREMAHQKNWPFASAVLEHHAFGVHFKLHPFRDQRELSAFSTEHRELAQLALQVWLWIENQRLNTSFASLEEYSFSGLTKCAGGSFWKNLLLNVRTFGAAASLDQSAPRYPRERLFNALPLLLAQSDGPPEFRARRHLQRQLRTRAEDWRGLVAAYKQVWRCYG